jgi:hypothetical protein
MRRRRPPTRHRARGTRDVTYGPTRRAAGDPHARVREQLGCRAADPVGLRFAGSRTITLKTRPAAVRGARLLPRAGTVLLLAFACADRLGDGGVADKALQREDPRSA